VEKLCCSHVACQSPSLRVFLDKGRKPGQKVVMSVKNENTTFQSNMAAARASASWSRFFCRYNRDSSVSGHSDLREEGSPLSRHCCGRMRRDAPKRWPRVFAHAHDHGFSRVPWWSVLRTWSQNLPLGPRIGSSDRTLGACSFLDIDEVSTCHCIEGLPDSLVSEWLEAQFTSSASPSALIGHALGNAVSCNVMERVIRNVLWAAGLVPKELPDYWREACRPVGQLANLEHVSRKCCCPREASGHHRGPKC